jgi:uncharacterized membrane protein
MKMNRMFRKWSRTRFWVGLFVLLAVVCGEFWMVCAFSRECARSMVRVESSAGIALPEGLMELR